MANMRGIAFLLVLVACGYEHGSHDDHNHAPPHGGRLVELGDHEFQVELVHSAEEGTLDAHLWDGHAEVPVPTTQKLLQVKVAVTSNSHAFTPACEQGVWRMVCGDGMQNIRKRDLPVRFKRHPT